MYPQAAAQGKGCRSPWPPYTVVIKIFSGTVTRAVDVGMKRVGERIGLTSDEWRDACHVAIMQ